MYQPEIMDAMKDEKCHVLEKFIEVKTLVSIIEGYDTPSFVSYWNVDPDFPRISLPLIPEGEYDFTVVWGDGMFDRITSHDQPETAHTYDLEVMRYTNTRFMVTLTGLLNGLSYMWGCAGISHWGCARIDVRREPPHIPRRKTRCQKRLGERRRKYHEKHLRAKMHSHMAEDAQRECNSDFLVQRDRYYDARYGYPCESLGCYDDSDEEISCYQLDKKRHNELVSMFVRWQPLGAEFKTNVTCDNETLAVLERDCLWEIFYNIPRI